MKIECPICKKVVVWPNGKEQQKPQWLPFCSERCKMIDLGKWLDADYRIPAEPEPEDEGTEGENT
jgi:uncharacterized protein